MRASLNRKHQQGMEVPQIRCAFHTEEWLTNFCGSKSCLMPLCPSCIKIHVNEHINMRTNPQLQSINDILRQIYCELENCDQKFNDFHKKFVEAETNVMRFREKLSEKIHDAKQNLITAVQMYFKGLEKQTMEKVQQLKYVQHLTKYKELTKRTILSLKNAERNFLTSSDKVMRMVIKYHANDIHHRLESFADQSQYFLNLPREHLGFNIKQNLEQASAQLNTLLQVDIREPKTLTEPVDLTNVLKELYEKQPQNKEIKRSLYKLLSHKNTPGRSSFSITDSNEVSVSHITPERGLDHLSDFAQLISSKQAMSVSQARNSLEGRVSEADILAPVHQNNIDELGYHSVKESIVKATQDLNFTLSRNCRLDGVQEQNNIRKRSISKGKGITLMQSNTTMIDFRKGNRVNTNALRCQADLTFINGRSQHIPRKFR